jgi:hypothetical protein
MSEIGSPAAQAPLSPGSVEDVHVHIDSLPATPRQYVISSSHELRAAITNPLYGIYLARVNEQHSHARRLFEFDWHAHPAILPYVSYVQGGVSSEEPAVFRERAAVLMGRYLMQNLLCRDSRVKEVRYDGTPRTIDLVFQMYQASPGDMYTPTTLSARLFATLDMGSMPSLNWSIGFDLVYGYLSLRQCRVAWIHSSIKPVRLEDVPIPCDLVIVEEHELEPFPWHVGIDNVGWHIP